ncbi:MAG: hypothetical protein DRO40_12520 [Thermoprotei archaeon]|nr:MAG: hypothetical protein DRO40_12520 [Thermoprotei archaeon]
MKIINVIPRQRWEIVFRDNDSWQAGIYYPEYISREEIDILEKHNVPELFYLIQGEIILVLSRDLKEIKEVPMEPGKLYIIDEWHNAYRPNGKNGVALVIERTNVKTIYTRIK